MFDAATEAAFQGGLKLPNGVLPKVGRFDAGSVLVQVEWDPGVTDEELEDAEDTILALIQHRRRERRRMANALATSQPSVVLDSLKIQAAENQASPSDVRRSNGLALIEQGAEHRSGSSANKADPGESSRAREVD